MDDCFSYLSPRTFLRDVYCTALQLCTGTKSICVIRVSFLIRNDRNGLTGVYLSLSNDFLEYGTKFLEARWCLSILVLEYRSPPGANCV